MKHKHVRKMQMHAALEHLKADLFPAMYSRATTRKTAITDKVTQEMADRYLAWQREKQAEKFKDRIAQEKEKVFVKKSKTIKKQLSKLDSKIKDVDVAIVFKLNLVNCYLLPRKESRISLGMEAYNLRLNKEEDELKLNAGGLTVGILSSTSELFDVACSKFPEMMKSMVTFRVRPLTMMKKFESMDNSQ